MSYLKSIIASTIDPPTKPDPIGWLELNLKFSLSEDAKAIYSSRKSPWHRTVFKWFCDDETQDVILIAPSQIGKSTFLIGSMMYAAQNDPGPMLLILSDETSTKQFCDRFSVTLEKSLPKLYNKDFSKDFGGLIGSSKLYLAWATSEAKLRSKPIRYVFADETSLYRHSLSFIAERQTNFTNRKAIYCTTPTTATEQTWTLANDTAQPYRMVYPCPNCGTYSTLDFDCLKFQHCKTAKDKWDYDRVENETYYKFKCCSYELHQRYQEELLQHGIATTDKPDRSPKRRSLRLSALDSTQKTWGQCCRKFLESKHSIEDQRNFTTQWLATPWSSKLDSLKAQQVQARKSATFKTNVAPINTEYLLCAADLQASGTIYGCVRAYLDDERSVLISAFKIQEKDISTLLERFYAEVINKAWQWEGHTEQLKINSSCIDSGDGNVTAKVYDFCLRHRGKVYPLKGQAAKILHPYKISFIENFPNSQIKINPPLPLYLIQTELFRETVISQYSRDVNEPGSLLITSEIPDEYFEHLESWTQVRVKDRLKWQRDPSKREDWLDAECYLSALNEITKEKTVTREIVSRVLKPPTPLTWNLPQGEIRTRY